MGGHQLATSPNVCASHRGSRRSPPSKRPQNSLSTSAAPHLREPRSCAARAVTWSRPPEVGMGTQEPPPWDGGPAETGSVGRNAPPGYERDGPGEHADPVPSPDPTPSMVTRLGGIFDSGRAGPIGGSQNDGAPDDRGGSATPDSAINPSGAEARSDPAGETGNAASDPVASEIGTAAPVGFDATGPELLGLPDPERKLPDPMPAARHGRNLDPDEPAARFHAQERPQRYATGIGQRQPTRPPDPIQPYMPPPVARRRRSEWPVMIFAIVIAGLVLVGCCLAGFAFYSGYVNPFRR